MDFFCQNTKMLNRKAFRSLSYCKIKTFQAVKILYFFLRDENEEIYFQKL